MMRNLCYFRSNDMMQWIKISLSFVSFSKIESSSSRDELYLPLYPWIFFFILCRQVEYTFIDRNILLLLYNREHRGIHSQCQPFLCQSILGQNRTRVVGLGSLPVLAQNRLAQNRPAIAVDPSIIYLISFFNCCFRFINLTLIFMHLRTNGVFCTFQFSDALY